MTETPRRLVAEWALLCEHAQFDADHRLNIERVIRRREIPRLNVGISDFALVVGFREKLPHGDGIEFGLVINTPSGLRTVPTEAGAITVEGADVFLIVTIRNMPLNEAGVYRIALEMDELQLAIVELPVLVVATSATRGTVH